MHYTKNGKKKLTVKGVVTGKCDPVVYQGEQLFIPSLKSLAQYRVIIPTRDSKSLPYLKKNNFSTDF